MRKLVALDNIFECIRNGASIKQGNSTEGLPITRIETISTGVINRDKMGFAGIIDDGKYNPYILKTGDILMSHINSEKHLGKIALYTQQGHEKIIHGMNLLCLTSTIQLPEYLYYALKSDCFYRQIKPITKKSVNQASFTVSALKKIEIPLPPLTEQQKIADTLDKVSHLIALRKKQLDKLDLLVKAKFVEMFGDPVENPMGWEKVELGKCFKVTSSKRIYQNELVSNGVPFYKISDLVAKIDGSKKIPSSFITKKLYNEHKQNNLVPNPSDILITSRGTLGKCYIVQSEDAFYFQDGMISWLMKISEISSTFFVALFETESTKRQIASDSSGATVNYISIEKLKGIKLLLPPLALQTQFADYVTQVETTKQQIQQGLEKLEVLYRGLMQEYFE